MFLRFISSMTKRPLGELAVSGYIRRQNRREFTGLRHCSTLYAGGAFEQPFPLLSITMPFLASFSMSSMSEPPLSLGAVHVPAMRAQRHLGFHLGLVFFAESPNSMSRLKASALDGKSSCFRRQASTRSIIVVSRRISKRSVLGAIDMSVDYVQYSVLYGT
jgi:hypothetical protein